ncbi:MAG: hypothetical protein E7416_03610 [Ruminococcaceae bacterium]|nr:hypothetical protein [Oscillospiraceae bacterium]
MKKITRLISSVVIVCMLLSLFTVNVFAADDTFTLTVTVPAKYAAGTVTLYVGGVAHNGNSGTKTEPTSTSDLPDGGKLYTYEGISSARTMYLSTYANSITKKKTYYFGNIPDVIGSTQNVEAEFYDNPGSSYRTSMVVTYTDAMDEYMNVPDTQAAQDAYNNYVKVTPYFQRIATNPLQMSTQTEQINFIKGLDDADDNLHFFENIQRSYKSANYYMSLVVFTESTIPEGATMDEAAAILKANNKPTILYKGQIHGNEQAPGEATLAMIKALDTDYGEELLKNVNMLVIPRVGTYSAYDFTRNVYSLNGQINPNRDCMMSITNEVTGTNKVFYKFMPEIVIDAHEYTPHTSATAVVRGFPDISYAVGTTLNTAAEVAAMGKNFVAQIRDEAKDAGLVSYIYDDTVSDKLNARYSAVKTVYNHPFYSQLGCLSFLIESPGGCGPCTGEDWIERRVTSHFIAAKAIFDYAAANATALRTTVKTARDKIVSDGAVYNGDDMFVLQHTSSRTPGTELVFDRIYYDIRTGTISEENCSVATLYPNDMAVRSRVRPTAYFIPNEGAWLEKDNLASVAEANKKTQYERARETLDKHSIIYYELPANASVMAMQYSGNAGGATLLPERVTTFENGGIVIPMNQVAGNVVGGLLEPDVTDNTGDPGTFMQQGLYTASDDGTLPVYRYVRDLSTTDLTYGGVTLATSEAPTNLTVVHKTTVDGLGSITGLNSAKLYEYAIKGDTTYIPVREGSAKISNLEPGTYFVRYRYADGTFSADVEITIEDQYTGARFGFYKPEFYDVNTNAMTGSKVLLTAIEGATYYRNGVAVADYEELSDLGAVAITVNKGLNNFSASKDDQNYGTVSVYGASLERYSSTIYGVGMHKSIDATAVKYTTASPNSDVSDLVDENHTTVYQAKEGNITENIKIDVTSTYPQTQQALGFYIDGELTSEFRPIALTASSGTKCKFTPVIKAGGRLYVDTLGSGEIDTGITVSSDEWHDIGIFSDFYNSGMTDLYLDGILVARGKIYTSLQGSVYVNSGDGPTNCYIGDAVNCVVTAPNDWPKAVTSGTGTKSKMFSNRASLVKVYPEIAIEEGTAESSVKVTLTDLSTFTGYEVKLFVNGEMIGTPVATDGTETSITMETNTDMSGSSVYAAVVDADGNIFNGFNGALRSSTLLVDIATTPVEPGALVTGSISSGKITVNRSQFPDAYKNLSAVVLEVKVDDSIGTTIMGVDESTKDVNITTTAKKVFIWILSTLSPLCEPITQ